nr:hypothetical protein [Tanacetum cinerariifolium]
MDPNSSLRKICLRNDVVVISSDKVEGSGDWYSPEYQDTAVSKGKKVKDKVELDRKTVKEEEDVVKRIKGEALKEKDDPGAFIFPIRLEGKVNENALADTGSDINTMPYRIYETLGRKEMKKIDKGITVINHTQAEAMGELP